MMSENEETTLSLAVVLREKGTRGVCVSRTLRERSGGSVCVGGGGGGVGVNVCVE